MEYVLDKVLEKKQTSSKSRPKKKVEEISDHSKHLTDALMSDNSQERQKRISYQSIQSNEIEEDAPGGKMNVGELRDSFEEKNVKDMSQMELEQTQLYK